MNMTLHAQCLSMELCKKNKRFSVTFPWKSFVKTTLFIADADGVVTLIESKATDIFEFQ